jgi:hypothetical protein
MSAHVDDGVLVASLRDRAEAARGEGTATAQGDAWYFDKSADAILALRADVTRLTASLAAAEAEAGRLRAVVKIADEAIAEYVRYLDGGELRGSYDGKPERNGVRKAGYATRAALAKAPAS